MKLHYREGETIATTEEAIRQKMARDMADSRRELNRQLFAAGTASTFHVTPPSRLERVWRQVRSYLLGWRFAAYALWCAVIGRDAAPPCDHDY